MNFACYRGGKKRIKLGTELISVRNVAFRTCFEFLPSPGLVWVWVVGRHRQDQGSAPGAGSMERVGEVMVTKTSIKQEHQRKERES